MTESTLHEIAMAAASLKMMPYDKRAAVDRMVADGRAEYTGPYEWRMTEAGMSWLGRVAG